MNKDAPSYLELKLDFEVPRRGLPFSRTRRAYNRQMRCLNHILELEKDLFCIQKYWPEWFQEWATSWDGCGWALSPAQKDNMRREKQLLKGVRA